MNLYDWFPLYASLLIVSLPGAGSDCKPPSKTVVPIAKKVVTHGL
ncbi:hypothetical protein HMPREF0539_2373 [Lacticaseibacillus rhamnosus LMS2-1]|uniref:Uncharacterized protein n=1 Tax=Lacticaseibacillus rhamnosus (strain LMS2-1) TaxID=525361 RepID=C2JZN8_LACRM|nr:conserved hypothetical protein [Lacticaseibacillus rhamnosus ATCC 8530]EEN79385.1 hypothetical protein HMPREF0539_2373 [Lacticaseibacillus rhamnosus LMS2-1]